MTDFLWVEGFEGIDLGNLNKRFGATIVNDNGSTAWKYNYGTFEGLNDNCAIDRGTGRAGGDCFHGFCADPASAGPEFIFKHPSSDVLYFGLAFKLAEGSYFGGLSWYFYRGYVEHLDYEFGIGLTWESGTNRWRVNVATAGSYPSIPDQYLYGHDATDGWRYIEIGISWTNAATKQGWCEVRYGSESVIFSDIYTGDINASGWTADTHKMTYMRNRSSYATDIYYDDIYITNTDFLGTVRVQQIKPSGDTSLLEWETSTGATHYDLIDEAYIDESEGTDPDDDYIESNVHSAKDLLAFEDVTLIESGVSAEIYGIVPIIYAKSPSGDGVPSKVTMLSQGTGALTENDIFKNALEEDEISFDDGYNFYSTALFLNPDTGLPFTEMTLNASRFGLRLIKES